MSNKYELSSWDQKFLKSLSHMIKVANTMEGCLWVGDKHHNTIYINPIFEELSGYTKEEALGKPCEFFFDEEGKKEIAKNHELRAQGKSSQYEVTMVSKTGQTTPLLINGAPTESGGTIGIFMNISNMKKLNHQKKIADEIIRNSTEAIVVLNQDRKIKLWSNGAEELFGYSEKYALNRHIDFLIPKSHLEENRHLRQTVDKRGHIHNIETKRQNKNEELIPVLLTVSKVSGKSNDGYLVIYRDLSQQKEQTTELQKRFEAIQDAYKELGLQRRYLDYLAEIVEMTTQKSTEDELGRLIISAFSLLTKCDSAVLRIYNSKTKTLKLKHAFGVNNKWLTKDQIKYENSIAEEAVNKKRPIIIEDVDNYRKHQGVKLLKSHKLKSLILVPLFVEDVIMGTVSLYSSDAAKFRLIESDFLASMGRQCSVALMAKHCIKRTS